MFTKTEHQIEAANAIARSRSRREEARRKRQIDRLFAIPAVIGACLMIWFITFPFPIEIWYVGLAGIILVVPYLARRLD